MSEKANNPEERFRRKKQREDDLAKQLPSEDDPPLPPPIETIKSAGKVDRNAPCTCGSGKKYKQCCGKPR